MIDIHSHLIYNVDDGSKSLEESINILDNYSKNGITDIILTPHYINETKYNSLKSDNVKIFKGLRKELKKNNIDINIYLGNEIYIDENIYELLMNREVYSLNGTNFVLIELPISGEYENYQEIIDFLIHKGCNVILAHPERYISFQKNFNKIYELEKMGVYFQSNIDSLIGRYGEEAEKTIKRLLKEKKISFLATDIHHKKHDYGVWKTAKEVALKYISEKEYEILTNINPSKLIN